MLDNGASQKEVLRADFSRSIMIDFQGAKITSNVSFFLVREMDERFDIIGPMGDYLEDLRCPKHTKHSLATWKRRFSVAPSGRSKNSFFKETCAIMASTRGLGSKNRNFEGFFPGKEVQKTILGLHWPRLRHNLSSELFFDCGGHGCRIISANYC
jgi:hypothetical protein